MSSASTRRVRKTVQRFTWRGIAMTATHTPNYVNDGWSHIELRVLRPKGIPVPITDTGYRSHFLDGDDVAAAGGAAAYFRTWLEREARSKAYLKALANWQQLDLFAWKPKRVAPAPSAHRPSTDAHCPPKELPALSV